MPGGYEWLIIIGVLLLLFGAKKLPDMARSVGQSARVFKGEMKGLKDDDSKAKPSDTAAPTLPGAQDPAPAAPTAPSGPTVTPAAQTPAAQTPAARPGSAPAPQAAQPQERPVGETAAPAQHDRTDVR